MEKLSKEDVRGPDQFIKTAKSVADYVEDHGKLVLGLLAALIIFGGAYAVWDFIGKAREGKAQEALFGARRTHDELVGKLEREIQKAHDEKEAKKAKDKTAKKDAKKEEKAEPLPTPAYVDAVGPAYEKVMNEHRGTKAGALAALEISDYYLAYGKTDDASKVLAEVSKTKTSPLVDGLVHFQLARVLESQGKCEAAIGEWDQIVKNAKLSHWHADALLKSGVCFQTLKQADKAREAYSRITKDFATTGAAQTAKKYLRLLDLAG